MNHLGRAWVILTGSRNRAPELLRAIPGLNSLMYSDITSISPEGPFGEPKIFWGHFRDPTPIEGDIFFSRLITYTPKFTPLIKGLIWGSDHAP